MPSGWEVRDYLPASAGGMAKVLFLKKIKKKDFSCCTPAKFPYTWIFSMAALMLRHTRKGAFRIAAPFLSLRGPS